MRDAETVLGVIRERGKRGLHLEDIYRQLFTPQLYLKAYARLYQNQGAMTPGTNGETVDGMSLATIGIIIDALRQERYRWKPVKRVYIPKKNGKLRPLGLPTWSDKLVQEVVRLILEAYYDYQFSDHAHGFRPARGVHTALTEITRTWTGTTWFIEGDIKGCFDNIDHQVLLSILAEKLHDNRFLRLLSNMLTAGYMEEWNWNATLSGSPQGGVVSPILSNIYLDKLDQYVETDLLPRYNQGKLRQQNPAYQAVQRRLRLARNEQDSATIHDLQMQMRQLPSHNPNDPSYRRLRYVRYADDFLLGFAGPREEAEDIKRQLREFLCDSLKLELSEEKTLVTHAATQAARFLGYEIMRQQATDRLDSQGRRCVNGNIALRIPREVSEKKCAEYQEQGKPMRRPEMMSDSDYTIVSQYQAEYRGFVQYYLMAQNVACLSKLHWVMETSLLHTLANKHKTSTTRIVQKYKTFVETPQGRRKCLRVMVPREGKQPLVAQFGGIPLQRQKVTQIVDKVTLHNRIERSELLQRLLADKCELCGSREHIQVHHVRKLADLKRHGKYPPSWVRQMAARRRKTLIVCQACHIAIHHPRMGTKVSHGKAG